MKPTPFASKTTPWRVQLPASLFPDKKRKARYFTSLEAAKKFSSAVKKHGLAAVDGHATSTTAISENAPLILAAIKKTGGNPERVFEALELLERMRLNVKGGLLNDVLDAFAESRRGKVQHDTWIEDNSRMNKLAAKFGNVQIIDITENDLEDFFHEIPGHKNSIFKTARVFFRWARKKNFIAINPMVDMKLPEDWNARKHIYPVPIFDRMLRIAAGLEGCRSDEEPTRDFIKLLPSLVLSGFCGLRPCEAFRIKLSDDAIKWEDLKFDRNPAFVHIRHEVAKRAKRKSKSNKRNIKNPLYVEAARAWLELVPRENEFITPSIQWTLHKLKRRFTARTGIKFLDNALRSSFASYALTAEGIEGVGQLALQMGNSEAICSGHYIETLEPGSGVGWFGLRPDRPANVVPMSSAAA